MYGKSRKSLRRGESDLKDRQTRVSSSELVQGKTSSAVPITWKDTRETDVSAIF